MRVAYIEHDADGNVTATRESFLPDLARERGEKNDAYAARIARFKADDLAAANAGSERTVLALGEGESLPIASRSKVEGGTLRPLTQEEIDARTPPTPVGLEQRVHDLEERLDALEAAARNSAK